MSLDLSPFLSPDASRVLIEARLRPIQGSRFQPTGFPDLGPALFETSSGQTLLVESAQSVANRLEATIWDSAKQELIPELKGLSYVRVQRPDNSYLTSSITEAHRLNSPYILAGKDKTLFQELKDKTAPFAEGVIDRARLARTIAEYDFNSLLHGLFLAKRELAGGRLRIERALSGFIEATGVRVAASGGVKNDPVNPSGDTSQGFGNVPFQRDEFTAESITAFFNLDLGQIRAYGLGAAGEQLLVALALYKVAAFLEGSLRLRTACDLECIEVLVRRPHAAKLPASAELRAALPKLVEAAKPLLGSGPRQVVFEGSEKKAEKKGKTRDESGASPS